MKEQITATVTNLFKIKSLVTIILTIVFAVLSIKGVVGAEQFLTVFSVVIAFYFGMQTQRSANENATNTTKK